jgi:hypothetical protein
MQDFLTQLNQNYPQAIYTLNGNIITGTWNKNAVATGAIGSTSIHFDYSVNVTLNPDMSFTYSETMSSQNSSAGPGSSSDNLLSADMFGANQQQQNPDSVNVFSSSSDTFKGKTFGMKQKGFVHEFGGTSGQNTVSYDFDAEKIKQPLFQALVAAGYHEQKKSFLKGLFGK